MLSDKLIHGVRHTEGVPVKQSSESCVPNQPLQKSPAHLALPKHPLKPPTNPPMSFARHPNLTPLSIYMHA